MAANYEYERIHMFAFQQVLLKEAGITNVYNVYVRTCFGGFVGVVAKKGRKWIVSRIASIEMNRLITDLSSENKQPFRTRGDAAFYLDGVSMNDAVRLKTVAARPGRDYNPGAFTNA